MASVKAPEAFDEGWCSRFLYSQAGPAPSRCRRFSESLLTLLRVASDASPSRFSEFPRPFSESLRVAPPGRHGASPSRFTTLLPVTSPSHRPAASVPESALSHAPPAAHTCSRARTHTLNDTRRACAGGPRALGLAAGVPVRAGGRGRIPGGADRAGGALPLPLRHRLPRRGPPAPPPGPARGRERERERARGARAPRNARARAAAFPRRGGGFSGNFSANFSANFSGNFSANFSGNFSGRRS